MKTPISLRNLIRVFADRMCRLKPPDYPKRDKREPLPYWVDAQADLESLLVAQVMIIDFVVSDNHSFLLLAIRFSILGTVKDHLSYCLKWSY